MAYKDFDGLSLDGGTQHSSLTLHIDGNTVDLPDASFVRDADIARDGMDLVLNGPDGTVVVEGYFAAEPTPNLVAPDGSSLTPQLVNSFAQSQSEFAQNASMTDESPVGAVQEVSGEATVRHVDGSVENITIGTSIYQGDVIETSPDGAVNITFIDDTSFAVSEDARLAIDEYVFDPATQSGSTDFSVLKGVFVFTSGLIGRDDPDDVNIDTPVGSIGIRGTIIAGNVNTGEITVVEGAIVLRDLSGNEMTLANQFETAKFNPVGGIDHMGELSASDVSDKFTIVSKVSPTLFSSINDAAAEQGHTGQEQATGQETQDTDTRDAPQDGDAPANNATEGTEVKPVGEGADAAPAPVAPAPVMMAPPPATTTFGHDTSGFNGPAPMAKPIAPMMNTAPAGTAPAANPLATAPTAPVATAGDPPPAPTAPPPVNTGAFRLEMSLTGFNEETPGAAVGTITTVNGLVGSASSFTLGGQFANLFQILATGNPNVFMIKLKAGAQMDADTLLAHGLVPSLNISATSTSGVNANITRTLNLHNVDEAPEVMMAVHDGNQTPDAFFRGIESGRWSHFFNKEFVNTDFGDVLKFELSANTVADLNTWATTPGGSILSTSQGAGLVSVAGDENKGWSFDESTGNLTLFFNTNFLITPGTFDTLDIEVRAVDLNGNYSGGGAFESFSLDAFRDNAAIPNSLFDGITGQVSVDTGSINTLLIGGGSASNNNKIFMLDNDDSVTISNGTGNYINLGDGNNTLVIDSNAANTQNIVVGGVNKDTFSIRNAENKLFGLDGDDDFKIDVSSTAVMTKLTNAGNANIFYDGGFSEFRAGPQLQALLGTNHWGGGTNGRGDTLELENAGNIDFSVIDDAYLRGFEQINAKNGFANHIKLDYGDVLAMTDHKKTLIITLDNNDTLYFNDEGKNFEHKGNISIDNARQGGASDMHSYDVYTDGNVTILVDNPGVATNVSGLPA